MLERRIMIQETTSRLIDSSLRRSKKRDGAYLLTHSDCGDDDECASPMDCFADFASIFAPLVLLADEDDVEALAGDKESASPCSQSVSAVTVALSSTSALSSLPAMALPSSSKNSAPCPRAAAAAVAAS
jgi:hypothetical protein